MNEDDAGRKAGHPVPLDRGAPGSLESAAQYTCGSARTNPGHDTPLAERRSRISAEQKRLGEWAEAGKKLKGKLLAEHARGGEHTVQFDEVHNRVLKATRPDAFEGYGIAIGSYSNAATPGEYLDRMTLQNKIFEDDVKLERVVPAGGKLSIITSQPFIKGRDATEEEIDRFMAAKGFEKIGHGYYHHPAAALLVHDLFPRNVKVSESTGQIHVIDPVIQRVQPDFVDDIKRHPQMMMSSPR